MGFFQNKKYTLEQALFLKACILGIALCVVGFSVNAIFSGNIPMVILNVICCLLLYILYVLAQKEATFNLALITLIFIALFSISLSWFMVNGLTGPASFNLIIVVVIMTSLINYQRYWYFIILVFFNAALLIFLQANFPEWVTLYPDKDTLEFDIAIALFTTLFFTSLPVYLFKKAYQINQKLVEDKNLRLLEVQKELEKAKEEAEESNRVKSNFLSIMSHEIRTPLNAIIGVSHILKEYDYESEDDQELAIALNASSEHLLNLLNDILDFSKIESGKTILNPQETNLERLLTNVYQTYHEKAKEKNNTLTFNVDTDVPNFIELDSNFIKQILGNLISNAIKFTDDGAVIVKVKKCDSNQNSAKLLFEVIDTGIGIPEDQHRLIFDKFGQVNSLKQKKEIGTGLGLSISRELLKLLNSEIYLESHPGKGSRFYFSIDCPVIIEPSKDINSISFLDTLPFENSPRLMLVEDNKVNVMVLARFLKKWNIKYDVAFNGLEALKLYEENVYDVILMDMQMPVMDGFIATRKLRERGCEIDIIALSASATQTEIKEARTAGVNEYIIKPFNPGVLYEVIKKAM
ncbi:MAG: ATP-binding protein [Saprospiraceae bacterium]|nr:ATP-binding protein [Saprospiraceae bacterium]